MTLKLKTVKWEFLFKIQGSRLNEVREPATRYEAASYDRRFTSNRSADQLRSLLPVFESYALPV